MVRRNSFYYSYYMQSEIWFFSQIHCWDMSVTLCKTRHYWWISFADFVSFSSSNGELFIIQYENKNCLIECFPILLYYTVLRLKRGYRGWAQSWTFSHGVLSGALSPTINKVWLHRGKKLKHTQKEETCLPNWRNSTWILLCLFGFNYKVPISYLEIFFFNHKVPIS